MFQLRRILRYALGKLTSLILTVFALVTIVFLLTKLIPGDEARVVAGSGASAEQVEQVRRRLGLNGSVVSQYFDYLGRLARGDLGVSNTTHAQVLHSILEVIPATAELVVTATVIVVLLAFPLAALSAQRQAGSGELTSRLLVVLVSGLPPFWLALVLQRLLTSNVALFPISGELSLGVDVHRITGATTVDAVLQGNWSAVSDSISHLVLPAFALALPYVGQLYRVLRAEMLRVSTREHVTVARAVGVRRTRLVRSHIVPQVLTPAMSIVGVEFGALFAGAVLVESIFGRPGIGSYLTNAVATKDTPSILGGVLVIGLVVILANYVVDVAQLVRDPRLRFAELGV